MVEHVLHRHGLLNRLLQQQQGLGGPSGERIGRPQGCGDPGDEEPDVRPLREVEGPFEHRDGLGEVPLAQRPKAHGPIRHDPAVGVIGGLGNPHPFLGEVPSPRRRRRTRQGRRRGSCGRTRRPAQAGRSAHGAARHGDTPRSFGSTPPPDDSPPGCGRQAPGSAAPRP